MKRKIKKILLILLLLVVLLLAVVAVLAITQSKYSPVKVGFPTERMIKRSAEYTDVITPLTADRFRKMIEGDTSHYKIVVITSPYCEGCVLGMRDVYLPMYKSLDTSRYKMYFIMDDCGAIVWEYDYFQELGIEDGYFFRDDDPLFRESNRIYRMLNIVNYATQPKRAFTWAQGVPLTLLINKEGKVKQVVEVYKDAAVLTPCDLRRVVQIDSMEVKDLNFDKIDTVLYADYDFDMTDYMDFDTVSFRTYKPAPPKKHFCTPDGKCY